jgi:hypothetical protein
VIANTTAILLRKGREFPKIHTKSSGNVRPVPSSALQKFHALSPPIPQMLTPLLAALPSIHKSIRQPPNLR